MKLTWLRRTFKDPNKISSSEELQWKRYAHAYALACIGSFLMADISGAAVNPVYLMWSSWIREKVRHARVTGYMQLFDEGTPVTTRSGASTVRHGLTDSDVEHSRGRHCGVVRDYYAQHQADGDLMQ
ncbi:hypothetical protein LINGRAPRIM_LOCUS2829 [Linum grandiflorum]